MFYSCPNLQTAPELPATTLAPYCYYSMFAECDNLINVPETLPATVLPTECYEYMFRLCLSLVKAPALPDKVANTDSMFDECISLVEIPNADVYIPGSDRAWNMFPNCTNITTPIKWECIPTAWGGGGQDCDKDYFKIENATSVKPKWAVSGSALQYKIGSNDWVNCVSGTAISTGGNVIKFRGSGRNRLFTADNGNNNRWTFVGTGIVVSGNMMTLLDYQNPPDTLGDLALAYLFDGCTTVVDAGDITLPAMNPGNRGYKRLFAACPNLTRAPALPATNVGPNCYRGLFVDCPKLLIAPELPAMTVATGGYSAMFNNCTGLITAPNLPATTLTTDCYNNMFTGCTNLLNAPGNDRYTTYTPTQPGMFTNCTKVETTIPYCEIPASFGGPSTFNCPHLTIKGASSVTPRWTTAGSAIQYRIGTGTWANATNKGAISTGGATIRFRGSGRTTLSTADNTGNDQWTIVGSDITVSGNICTLLDYENPPMELGAYAFAYLFTTVNLVNVDNLSLPATTMGSNSYKQLFSNCTKLVNPPALPATTLNINCYRAMFQGCTSLVKTPALPATTLVSGCYSIMFYGCTSLVNVPVLPATILVANCYDQMFTNCSSIVTPPALPATTLATYCYNYMFNGCTSLTTTPSLPVTTLATYCYAAMFSGCTNITTAPLLPATSLTTNCYSNMFYNCIKLTNASGNDVYTSKTPAQAGMFTGAVNVETTIPYCAIPASFGGGDGDCDFFFINATSVTPVWTTAGDPLQYRLGTGSWSNATSGTAISTGGNNISFRGTGRTSLYTEAVTSNGWTVVGADVKVFGKIANLLNYTNPPTTLGDFAFAFMFYRAVTVIQPPTLPFMNLGISCYHGMFTGAGIMYAPALPATILANKCYVQMLAQCNGLTVAPTLPATTLATSCYQYMFRDSINIIEPPVMGNITSVGNYSCGYMFYGCTNLITAPSLPAMTLGTYCYEYMFYGCTSLVTAPTLPATTLAIFCYEYMFYGCTSLTSAPVLPSTTIVNSCYTNMFSGCISLVTVPALPATTLANNCYSSMFMNCTSIVNAPALNATTVINNCYTNMFSGCTSLINGPDLPAVTLVANCYNSMFNGCTNLINTPNNNVYTSKSPAQADMFTGAINVETTIPYCQIPTNFGGGMGSTCPFITINNATSVTPRWTTTGTALQYRIGTGAWTNAVSGTAISVTGGADIRFRGSGRTSLFTSHVNTNAWAISGTNVIINGNMNSLLDYKTLPTSIGNYAFDYMFYNCTNITTLNITLPATTLAQYCYFGMFWGCNKITSGPSLPATTLATYCYGSMYNSCTSLVTPPVLIATTLATYSYYYMFYGCTSLVNAPSLSTATALASYCCYNMFGNCTSIVTAPALPLTTLATYCYYYMFSGCTSLVTGPALSAGTLQTGCYQYMFNGCTSLVNTPGNDVYTAKSPAQANMFTNCTKVENSIPYCEIPANFGGPT
jgi:hypothetical protein